MTASVAVAHWAVVMLLMGVDVTDWAVGVDVVNWAVGVGDVADWAVSVGDIAVLWVLVTGMYVDVVD